MLRSTFIHAPGVGEATERKLWDAGIRDWEDFLAPSASLPVGAGKRAIIAPVLEESRERLTESDHRFFARALPAAEHWRAAGEFAGRLGFLDIETTGMGTHAHPTVVGLYDFAQGEYHAFVYGENLRDFPDVVDEYQALVTFFGTGFDLPVLRQWEPRIEWHQLHVDLCPLLRRLGYRGGLKRIEKALGIERSDMVEGMDGMDAVRLWWKYRRGDADALRTLIEYNEADVVNMVRLLGFASRKMQELQGFQTPQADDPPAG